MFYRRFGKRALDLCIAIPLLLLASPIIALVSIALSFTPPVLFIQIRPGLRAKPFKLYKFRTMTNERNPEGDLLADNLRTTRLGSIIRQLSLDEILQLINVIRGDMSLVGPRPLLMEYLPLYSSEQSRRHDVAPGITGLAQVEGRNLLCWEDKFRLDVRYVDNVSLLLDIKILLKTALVVLQRQGISARGGSSMDRFTGTPL